MPNLVLVGIAAVLVVAGVALSGCAAPQVVFGDNYGSVNQNVHPTGHNSTTGVPAPKPKPDQRH